MTGVDVAAIRARLRAAVDQRWVRFYSAAQCADHIRTETTREWVAQFAATPHIAEFIAHAPTDIRALLDALAVAEQQRDDAYATIRAFIGSSDAWFGAWACGCSDTERTPVAIPEFCPTHGRALLSNFAGQTKVQLNHSGVSGYGIHPGPPTSTPTAETVPPRVTGTGGPQNPAQGCGHVYPDGAACTPDGHADLADRAAAHDRPGVE